MISHHTRYRENAPPPGGQAAWRREEYGSSTHVAESLLALCVVECDACRDACLALARRLSAGPGDFAARISVRCLLDCAQACTLAIEFIGRGAALPDELCAVCGENSEACAERLELTGSAGECAEACRRCAEACFEVWRAASGVTLERRDAVIGARADARVQLREARAR